MAVSRKEPLSCSVDVVQECRGSCFYIAHDRTDLDHQHQGIRCVSISGKTDGRFSRTDSVWRIIELRIAEIVYLYMFVFEPFSRCQAIGLLYLLTILRSSWYHVVKSKFNLNFTTKVRRPRICKGGMLARLSLYIRSSPTLIAWEYLIPGKPRLNLN